MAFKIDDMIVDRIQVAYMETTGGDPIGTLTQLSEATLEVSAESTDAVDKNGTLIKRFWKGKTGTFTATNAMLNLNVMAQMSGTSKKDASVAADATYFAAVPGLAIVKIAANQTAKLPGYVDKSAKVNYLFNNGTMGKTVTTDQYTIATGEDGVATFTAPAEKPSENGKIIDDIDRVIVRYNRTAASGVATKNSADKFPQTIRLILKVLIVD